MKKPVRRGFRQHSEFMYLAVIGKTRSRRVMRLAKRDDVPIAKIIKAALDAYLKKRGV